MVTVAIAFVVDNAAATALCVSIGVELTATLVVSFLGAAAVHGAR